MTAPDVRLAPGSRIALFGRAGSGKTTWSRWYIARSLMRWVVIDSKHDPGFDDWRPSEALLTMDELDAAWKERRAVVVRPSPFQAEKDVLDAYLLDIHDAFEGIGVLIDEGYQVARGTHPGPGITGLLTRGRVRRQTVIVGSQRPAWLPRFVFSEANAFTIMSLSLKSDRDRVYEFTGKRAVLEPLPPQTWFWYDVSKNHLTRFAPVILRSPAEQAA